MAIAFDTSTGTDGNGTTLTFSHTCTGSNLILFVSAGTNVSGSIISGVTYNGVALTNINLSGTGIGSLWKTSLWYLVAPATGANNVVITGTITGRIAGASASYTGALQISPIDSNAVNNDPGPGSVSTLTGSTTVVANNCWVVMGGSNDNGGPLTAGTGSTGRFLAPTSETGFFDSNGTVSAGSYSMTFNGGNGHYTLSMASFKPAAATTNGNFLMLM